MPCAAGERVETFNQLTYRYVRLVQYQFTTTTATGTLL